MHSKHLLSFGGFTRIGMAGLYESGLVGDPGLYEGLGSGPPLDQVLDVLSPSLCDWFTVPDLNADDLSGRPFSGGFARRALAM